MVSPETGKDVGEVISCFGMVVRDSRQGKTGGAGESSTSSDCKGIGL